MVHLAWVAITKYDVLEVEDVITARLEMKPVMHETPLRVDGGMRRVADGSRDPVTWRYVATAT
jgi:hypothetical protein